jgi:hypothetical protein
LVFNPFLFAQILDCDRIASFVDEKETQISQLNLQDPDFIPLHFLKSKDIIKEFEKLKLEKLPYLKDCKTIVFNEFINKFDDLLINIRTKHDSLAWLNNNVYLMYYEKALVEYKIKNEEEGEYLLYRSLQYNPTFPDAILLKLSKLLDNNRFNECLSLLNILYYETELDRKQEMLAIEFTDNFYEKLYQTGDSLAKLERAAEALELFDILEVFCFNLPTSYCNDDYYHGILRSKSGIYESYLSIAEVARKRGNKNVAEHFYQYAQDYLDDNPHLRNYEPKNVKSIPDVREVVNIIDLTEGMEEPNKIIEINEIVEIEVIDVLEIPELIINPENVEPKLSPKEMKEKYDRIIFDALALCIKDDFSASHKLFIEAQKLEECQCFETDYRVKLMLSEFEKFGIK